MSASSHADSYEALIPRLRKFFAWRRCASPEDLAQEVLVRGLRRLSEGIEIQPNPAHYFFGIARLVLHEERRRSAREPGALPDDAVATDGVIGPTEDRILLSQVLGRLAPDDRRLLERYHLGNRDALRRELQLSAEALRVRVHRLHRRIQAAVGQLAPERPGNTSGRGLTY